MGLMRILSVVLFLCMFAPAVCVGADRPGLFGGPNPFEDCRSPVILSTSPVTVVCLDVAGGVRTVVAGKVGGSGQFPSAQTAPVGVFPFKTSMGYVYMPISKEEQIFSSMGKLSMAAVGIVQQPQNQLGFAALGAVGAVELWKVLRSSTTRKSEWNFIWSR